MLSELTLPNASKVEEPRDLRDWFQTAQSSELDWPLLELLAKAYGAIFGSQHARLVVSTGVLPDPEITNETVPIGQEESRVLTPSQAYHLALSVLEDYEKERDAYLKEEARLLSIFDEDE